MKISKDGSEIYLLKTLFKETIDETTFKKKAKVIDTTSFIKQLPFKYRKQMIDRINRVIDLDSMKLTMFGSSTHSDKTINLTLISIFTGGKTFFVEYGPDAIYNEKQEAIEHSKKYYGEDFFKRHGHKLFEDTIYYFKDKVAIDKEEYEKLTQEHRDLTSLITLKNTQECNNKNKRI